MFPGQTHLHARLAVFLSLVFILHGPVAAQKNSTQERTPSTAEERAKVIRVARLLEADPLRKDAQDLRAAVIGWLANVPDITLTVCDLVPDLLDSKKNYAPELFGQILVSSAAFLADNLDLADDHLLVNTAGVEGMLNAYQAILKDHPQARWPVLDALLKKRPTGELEDYVREATSKCEKLKTEDSGGGPKVALANKHLHHGHKFFDSGQYQLALIEYRRALELIPSEMNGYHELSQTFYELKNWDKSIEYAKRAIELNPKCSLCYQSLGNTYDESGKPDEALNAYVKAIEVAPTKGQPLYNYALTLVRLNRLPEATVALEKAISVEPQYASPYRFLGNILAKSGEVYPAEARYRKFIEIERSGERFEKVTALLKAHVHLDPDRVKEKSPQAQAYARYGVVRAHWIMERYHERNPTATRYRQTVDEEVEALTEEAKTWQESRKASPQAIDDELDRLLTIYTSGNLEAYVYSYLGQKFSGEFAQWKSGHTNAMEDFQKWAAANSVASQPIRQAARVEWLGVDQ